MEITKTPLPDGPDEGAVLHLVPYVRSYFSGYRHIFSETKTHNIQIKFQISPDRCEIGWQESATLTGARSALGGGVGIIFS